MKMLTNLDNSKSINWDRFRADYLTSLINLPGDQLPEKIRSELTFCRLEPTFRKFTPVNYLSAIETCPSCLIPRKDENCDVLSLPDSPKSSLRRILSKVQRNKRLSAIEKKLAMRAADKNILEVTCKICSNKSKIRAPRNPSINVTISNASPLTLSKKKKKKKKPPVIVLNDSSLKQTTILESLSAKKKKKKKSNTKNLLQSNLSVADNSTMITIDDDDDDNTTVIENLHTKNIKQNVPTKLNSSHSRSSILVQDSPNKTLGRDFIPLVASTPHCKSTQNNNRISAAKKRARTSLQNLIDLEHQKKHKGNNSLKAFLNKL